MNGHPAAAVTLSFPAPPGAGTYTAVAWHQDAQTVVIASGYRLSAAELVRDAESVVYVPGTLPPAVLAPAGVVAPACRVLPPGALSRKAILQRYASSDPEVVVSAKLVRLSELEETDPELTECIVRLCAPGQVVWLILEQAPDNRFAADHPSPGGSPPPPQGPSYTIFPVDAASGIGRGDSSSNIGFAPSYWSALVDLAP